VKEQIFSSKAASDPLNQSAVLIVLRDNMGREEEGSLITVFS
jgi:hypothetical protein